MKRVNLRHLICFIAVLAILPLSALSQDEATTPEYDIDYSDFINFHWKGDVTSHSMTVKVFPSLTKLAAKGFTSTFIAVYTKAATGGAVTVNQIKLITIDGKADTDYPVGTLTVDSLSASTTYYYCFVFGTSSTVPTNEQFLAEYPSDSSSLSGEEFSFTTFALALTKDSFTFGVGCCAQTNSTSEVFDYLSALKLNFFVQTGNMHYDSISANNVTQYYLAYNNVFSSSKQRTFYQQTPVVYAWDEFDYGAKGSNGNSASRPAATTAYKRYVPATNLKAAFPADDSSNGGTAATTPVSTSKGFKAYDSTATGEYGIFRSFLVGRCMFILLDLRSFKDITANDVLGSSQLAWLNNQLLYASMNSNIRQIFLISSLPWNNKAAKTEWSTYATTQSNVHDWVVSYINGTTASVKQKIMLLGGGASMLAFDDGSNNSNGKFPVVQAGGLDQTASCAGGSYSHGMVSGRQQYAIVQVTDDGTDNICVKVNLTRATGTPLIYYDTCNSATAISQATKVCSGSLIDSITDYVSGGSWVWFIIIMVIIAIVVIVVLYKVYLVYKQRRQDAQNEGEPSEYIEMSESKKKGKSDLVL